MRAGSVEFGEGPGDLALHRRRKRRRRPSVEGYHPPLSSRAAPSATVSRDVDLAGVSAFISATSIHKARGAGACLARDSRASAAAPPGPLAAARRSVARCDFRPRRTDPPRAADAPPPKRGEGRSSALPRARPRRCAAEQIGDVRLSRVLSPARGVQMEPGVKLAVRTKCFYRCYARRRADSNPHLSITSRSNRTCPRTAHICPGNGGCVFCHWQRVTATLTTGERISESALIGQAEKRHCEPGGKESFRLKAAFLDR